MNNCRQKINFQDFRLMISYVNKKKKLNFSYKWFLFPMKFYKRGININDVSF